MKECNICYVTKDLSEFHSHKNNPDGKTGYCKDCRSLRNTTGLGAKSLRAFHKVSKVLGEQKRNESEEEFEKLLEKRILQNTKRNKKPKVFKPTEPLVYAVLCPLTQRVKIGESDDLKQRFASLCRNAGIELKLLGVILNESKVKSQQVEKAIHKIFHKQRHEVYNELETRMMSTEWFDLTGEVHEFIDKYFEEYDFELPLEAV